MPAKPLNSWWGKECSRKRSNGLPPSLPFPPPLNAALFLVNMNISLTPLAISCSHLLCPTKGIRFSRLHMALCHLRLPNCCSLGTTRIDSLTHTPQNHLGSRNQCYSPFRDGIIVLLPRDEFNTTPVVTSHLVWRVNSLCEQVPTPQKVLLSYFRSVENNWLDTLTLLFS